MFVFIELGFVLLVFGGLALLVCYKSQRQDDD